MTLARVGILGYGVIGRRAADAVRMQDDMTVVGVAGRSASFSLRDASLQGYEVYLTDAAAPGDPSQRMPASARGTLGDLLGRVDVLLDCTPSRVPPEYRQRYDRHEGLVVIVQGGERHSFGGTSFSALANYDQARGRKRIRVISCSSTGTARFLQALDGAFGVRAALVTLVRRACDPAKRPKHPCHALAPTMGQSHHGPDVRTVLPDMNVLSVSVDAPTTLAHVLTFQVDLDRPVSPEEVARALDATPRVLVGEGLRSTADLAEHFRALGRRRGDRPEIYVWRDAMEAEGCTVYASVSVHMESITIPDTVDCIRAALDMAPDKWASIRKTDQALGIAKDARCYLPLRRRAPAQGVPA